ncbi:MAG: qorA5 [Nocardia sp.]|uniref:NADP-dependent oxidoreductase n=1 Tax=Nocardia sp. TaxID=1821 RepID=UPI002613BEEA|nr:NADP-dependent oxidoreductase [Nocardia sp.]MCU1644083.1 qorA5 [Nocardia sp.]
MRTITQQSVGGPQVLAVADVPQRNPGRGEILVQVRAAGVNPFDCQVRAGQIQLFGPPPFTLGLEFSGVVADVGVDAGEFRPGDEVFGSASPPHGSHAEYVLVPATSLAAKPHSLDHVHAAALPIAGSAALQALTTVAGIRAGQRVLVHGAAGGVGHLCVQIAKSLGASVVGTARAINHPFLAELGADELIDYTTTDFATLRDIDVVLDTISHDYGLRSLDVLVPGGLLIDVVGLGIDRTAVKKRAGANGLRFVEFYVEPNAKDLARLAELADQGRLRPSVHTILPLTEAATAHELSESRHVRGKLVLVP